MGQEETPREAPDERPFVAPCRQLTARAPLAWVGAGWRHYRAARGPSLVYGLTVFGLSLAVTALAWEIGRFALVLAMLSGFIFVAPLMATGLYSICRQVKRGEPVTIGRSVARMRQALGNSMIFALILMIIFLVWLRAASMVHVFFPAELAEGWTSLLPFLAVGSLVGSLFAFVTFSAAAFSLPMIVDRDVDMVTATVTSVNAVLRNKPAMVTWAALIVALTGLGFATAGLGLVVTIPVLGYATYEGYLETIDGREWAAN